jgi:tripartite-type tricarboxylate transporter receptor subunit TctC
MTEAGYAGIGTGNWQGLFASRQTAADIVGVLHRAAVKAMNSPETKAAFDKVNAAVTTSETPVKFAAEINGEMATWQRLLPEVLALPQE